MTGPSPDSKRRRSLRRSMRALPRDTHGGTAIEYGLVVALIFLAALAALQGVANTTVGIWNDIGNKVTNAH